MLVAIMKPERRDAIRKFLHRPGTEPVEVTLSAEAAAKLNVLSSFGVSGVAPEVTQMYASRLLEQALEDLGDDPIEGIQKVSPREPVPVAAGAAAPDAVLIGEADEPAHLKDQWAEQTALLVFLRHYG